MFHLTITEEPSRTDAGATGAAAVLEVGSEDGGVARLELGEDGQLRHEIGHLLVLQHKLKAAAAQRRLHLRECHGKRMMKSACEYSCEWSTTSIT